jgi:hypothetical protein
MKLPPTTPTPCKVHKPPSSTSSTPTTGPTHRVMAAIMPENRVGQETNFDRA